MMQKSDWSERLRAIRFGRSPFPSNYGAKLLIQLVIHQAIPTNITTKRGRRAGGVKAALAPDHLHLGHLP